MLRVENLDRDEGWIVVLPLSEVDRAVRTAANGSQHPHGRRLRVWRLPRLGFERKSDEARRTHGRAADLPKDLSSTSAGGHRMVSARRFRAGGRVFRHPAAAARDRLTEPC